MNPPYNFYFAGELFDAKHLIGNAFLAANILKKSEGKYRPTIPQDLEQRSLHPHDIRDEDILALLQSDLALFHFDGVELDSGTVVEFMLAKFADIPSVILRSDFRASGDQIDHPWNLMVSFYPRTEVIQMNALQSYKLANVEPTQASENLVTDPEQSIERATHLINLLTTKVIHAFDRVIATDALLEGAHEETVFGWLEKMCGFKRSKSEVESILNQARKRRSKLN